MAARAMQFSSVESLTSFAMGDFLRALLKKNTFEEMRVPLAIVASDLTAGAPVVFKERGDVLMPIYASCAYPGLFPPVRYMDHCLVDGMVSMDIPAAPLRRMGATHVISVLRSGQIFTEDGLVDMGLLREWLKSRAAKDPHPTLLIRASSEVTLSELIEIEGAARDAGFRVLIGAEDRGPGSRPAGSK